MPHPASSRLRRAGPGTILAWLLLWAAACAPARPPAPPPGLRLGPAPLVSVVDLPGRWGGFQRILILSPRRPRVLLVLLPGGDGVLALDPLGQIHRGQDQPLVRAAPEMVGYGLGLILVDAPSEQWDQGGLDGGYRCGVRHRQDLMAVLDYLEGRWPGVPRWAVGYGRGALSAARLALPMDQDLVDGLVLVSPPGLEQKGPCSLRRLPLEEIRVPTLIIQHEQDACPGFALEGSRRLLVRLKSARESELLAVRGGASSGPPCSYTSFHGFAGRIRDLGLALVRWVLTVQFPGLVQPSRPRQVLP